jgi:methylenetetrahydrofolate reductase (NADPH)
MTTLQQKLASGRFVITAEVTPPLTASAEDLLRRVAPLSGLIDAVNLTDAASARPSLSSLAAAAIVAQHGFEPICQLTSRDRNRIALIGDLLGAAAQGVRNVLVLHGDDPAAGDMPDAKAVRDLDSRSLMSLIRDMRDRGKLPSGRVIAHPPALYIGCADTPIDPPPGWKPEGLAAKIDAGAQFAQTQFCFDVDVARRYLERLDEAGIIGRLPLILGIGVLSSARQARFMRENMFGVSVPEALIDRLAKAADARIEGRIIATELIAGLRALPGVAGVHLMAPLQPATSIAEVLRDAVKDRRSHTSAPGLDTASP